MAGIAHVLAYLPEDVRTLLADAFAREGVASVVDVACIMGDESSARDVAVELVTDIHADRVTSYLIEVWKHCRVPAAAIIGNFVKKLPCAGTFTSPAPGAPAPPARLLVSSAASSLFLRTTVAAVTGCRAKTQLPLSCAASSSSSTGPPSAKADLEAEWEAVLVRCRSFLVKHGVALPRFIKLFGQDGTRIPPPSHLLVQDDVYRGGSTSPPTIIGYLRETNCLVAWANALGRDFFDLSEFETAAFLKDQCARGPSVPLGCFRALVWSEKAFDLCLHSSAAVVISQSNPSREAAAAQAVAAQMATPKMLIDMEHAVWTAPTAPLRAYAGAMCALGHGVLRWKDLQRSEQVHLTPDAIVAVTWRMKKKKVRQPWAALRIGLSGEDWAAEWIKCLESFGMPGTDFMLLAVSKDLTLFKDKVATYSDGINALRALLVLAGMPPDEAMGFTLHSWRHLFPTAARQLRLPEHEQVELGHWATGSSMPRRYDSAACVTELIAKSAVSSALRAGWAIAAPGCVPRAPPTAEVLPPLKHAKRAKTRNERVPFSPVSVTKAVKVIHVLSGKVHMWTSGERTACAKWKCGTSSAPTCHALFPGPGAATTSESTSNCLGCFTEKLGFLKLDVTEETEDEIMSDEFEEVMINANLPAEGVKHNVPHEGPDVCLSA